MELSSILPSVSLTLATCSKHGREQARKEVHNMNEIGKSLTAFDILPRPFMTMGR